MARLGSAIQGSGHRVGVVDDDPDLRASMRALLERQGHLVATAEDAVGGLELVEGFRPHLLLLDYYLGRGTGAELVREIREFDPSVQVLLVTGYAADQPGRRLLAELDIQGYHDKSDGAERLLVLVDAALKHWRARQSLVVQRRYLERILAATPELSRLQPPRALLTLALEHLRELLLGGDGLIATTNHGLFVLGDAQASVSIHAATGKFQPCRSLRELPRQTAKAIEEGILSTEPFFDPRGLMIVPLRTRQGDRGCMALECAGITPDAVRPCMLYAQQVVQSLENVLLYEMATVDALTRAHNRAHGEQRIREAFKLAERAGRPTSLLMVDIDHFKRVNDEHGHAAGDLALRRVGEALMETCRESDTVIRFGGEEFVVLAPDTDVAGALALGERVRVAVEALEVVCDDLHLPLSVSVGAATAERSREAPSDLLARADLALYRAKSSGRNRVVTHRPSMVPAASARAASGAAA